MAKNDTKNEGIKKSSGINFQKKLSTNKICGKITARDVEVGETKDLYHVVGLASGQKSGATDFGEWVALTGNFAAVNLTTGEKFRSGVCFLPDVALDPILGQLNGGATVIEFGWCIGIKGDDTVQCGYVYYARPLVEPDENDPLEKLSAHMAVPVLEDKTGK